MKIQEINTEGYQQIMDTYHVSSLCAKVICANNLDEDKIKQLFQTKGFYNPFQIKNMKKIVDRIYHAKQAHEKIIVCGDYDADGICATTILVDTLKKYGCECGYYIPDRIKEGYGLSLKTVQLAYEKGYKLLITVDNGVKCHEQITYAKKLGIDVILTDHHAYDEIPEDVFAYLHPFEMDEELQYLCGAGVAFQLSKALLGSADANHCVLACIATIGDVMQLWGENREIVKAGIYYLNKGYMKPIQNLKNSSSLWNETTIAFQVVPKLNVTGRLSEFMNVNNTVKFLCSTNDENIVYVQNQISMLNEKRKSMNEEMKKIALNMIDQKEKFIVVSHKEFHEGIVGLLAGSLANEYMKPVMVLSENDSMMKGSIRSVEEVDLTHFFDDLDVVLSGYGGHTLAAGISFEKQYYSKIKNYIQRKMETVTLKDKEISVLKMHVYDNLLNDLEVLEKLSPFGEGFKKPQFYFKSLHVKKVIWLSNGLHIKIETDEMIDVLIFNVSENDKKTEKYKKFDVIGDLNINVFRNIKKLNIIASYITENNEI